MKHGSGGRCGENRGEYHRPNGNKIWGLPNLRFHEILVASEWDADNGFWRSLLYEVRSKIVQRKCVMKLVSPYRFTRLGAWMISQASLGWQNRLRPLKYIDSTDYWSLSFGFILLGIIEQKGSRDYHAWVCQSFSWWACCNVACPWCYAHSLASWFNVLFRKP